jgi:hypothetical protein
VSRRTRPSRLAAIAAAALSCACVTIKQETVRHGQDGRTITPTGTPTGDGEASRRLGDRVVVTPAGVARTSVVTAEVVLLGAVPYDDLSLPAVSPDGRFVATQTGVPPTWPTVLAQRDAAVPEATRIEMYQVSMPLPSTATAADETTPLAEPTLIATVDRPALLGRSCDHTGVLVEVPQPDGSRWIGKASWETGAITWLVQDDRVNAFASLGPDGRLAWSRRPRDEDRFELVVRRNQQEWSWRMDSASWLMPTWGRGGQGDGLFALQLGDAASQRGGTLHAAHLRAESRAAMLQSIRRTFLAEGATPTTAMQCVAGRIETLGLDPIAMDQFVFLHPARLCMAVWRPFSPGGSTTLLLARDSVAALVDQPKSALVTTQRCLVRQQLIGAGEPDELLAGTLIPRPVRHERLDYLLLGVSQQRHGWIGLTGLRLRAG